MLVLALGPLLTAVIVLSMARALVAKTKNA
jgi:hypothetical protein